MWFIVCCLWFFLSSNVLSVTIMLPQLRSRRQWKWRNSTQNCVFLVFFFHSLKMIKLLICVQSIYCSSLCHRDQWDGWISVCALCVCTTTEFSTTSIHPSIDCGDADKTTTSLMSCQQKKRSRREKIILCCYCWLHISLPSIDLNMPFTQCHSLA